MRGFRSFAWQLSLLLLVSIACNHCLAQSEGQADLDAATALKLNASSMADLEKVIDLTESAIKKGLDKESEDIAKSLITATLFQHGSRYAQALLDPRQRGDQPAMLRQFALKDLYKILEYDDSLPQVHMMIARLEGINVGQQDMQEAAARGRKSADQAIALLDDDKSMQSKAYILRAGYESFDSDNRVAFLDKALAADPTNTDALRQRGKTRLVKGELLSAAGKLEEANAVRTQAIADFMQILEGNPNDPDALQSGAELLGRVGQFDKAMEFANQVMEQNPGSFSTYLMRARLYHRQGKHEEAIADLNEAVDIKPGNFLAYLDRAEVYYDRGDLDAAAADYGKARELRGTQLPRTVIDRMRVRSQNDVEKGIAEMKMFLEMDDRNAQQANRDPDPEYRLILATTFVRESRPQDVVDVLTPLIESTADSYEDSARSRNAYYLALRDRGGSYLSLGKHQEAIDDYQKAREIVPNDPNVLNNLAWVLATSPQDDLRNAPLAIELATKACEVTKYEAAHILSTLAAAYADSGDFDNAMKYSSQAVDLASAADSDSEDKEMLQQLQSERASYEKQQPWRELQNAQQPPAVDNGDSEPESSTDTNNSTAPAGDEAPATADEPSEPVESSSGN